MEKVVMCYGTLSRSVFKVNKLETVIKRIVKKPRRLGKKINLW